MYDLLDKYGDKLDKNDYRIIRLQRHEVLIFPGTGLAKLPKILNNGWKLVRGIKTVTTIGSLTPIGNAPSLTTTKESEFENEESVVSNKGNTYDNTKSDKHEKTTTRDADVNGEPNSSVDIYDSKGRLTRRRWYGPDGKVIRDVDYTNHGNPN